MTNDENAVGPVCCQIPVSDFRFLSDFVIRISDFCYGCGGIGFISPLAIRSWYWLQLIFASPLGTETMVIQSSTGQTREQRLHPTHSGSLISGIGLPGTRPGPSPWPFGLMRAMA